MLIFRITSLSTSLVLVGILYASYGIMIALVRPYKKTYMNVINTLITANLALLSLMAERHYLEDSSTLLAFLYAITISTFTFLLLLDLSGFIAYRILKRIRNKLDPCHTKFHTINSNEPTAATAQQDLPDRMLYHQQYTIL